MIDSQLKEKQIEKEITEVKEIMEEVTMRTWQNILNERNGNYNKIVYNKSTWDNRQGRETIGEILPLIVWKDKQDNALPSLPCTQWLNDHSKNIEK